MKFTVYYRTRTKNAWEVGSTYDDVEGAIENVRARLNERPNIEVRIEKHTETETRADHYA